MASNSKVSVALDHLSCPICLYVPRDSVFMCGNSHNICSDCHDQLSNPKTCPECRLTYEETPSRNFTLQKMIADLDGIEFKCKHAKFGCDHVARRQEVEAHERECQIQGFQCPLKNCKDMVAKSTFYSHCLADKHKNDVHHLKIEEANVKNIYYPVTEPNTIFRPCVWLWNNTPIILFWEFIRETERSYFWIAIAGNESEAQKYSCEISLVNDHIEPDYKFKGPVHSIDKKLDFVAEFCLGLPLTNDVIFRYKMKELNDKAARQRILIKITIHEK